MERLDRKYKRILLFTLCIVLLILSIAGTYLIFAQRGLKNAEKTFEKTEKYAQGKIIAYENYQINDRTKSLMRLVDKTIEASRNLAVKEKGSREALSDYISEQNITGIIVLDEKMDTDLQIVLPNEIIPVWKDILQEECIQQIISSSKKVYMTRTKIDDGSFDIAVVPRTDKKGAVISYTLQDTVKDGVNDITLKEIFQDMLCYYSGHIIISLQDKGIIASNEECMLTMEQLDNLSSCKKIKNETFGKTVYNGKQVYIKKTTFGKYNIYIMLSVHDIYIAYYIIIVFMALVYLIIFGIIYFMNIISENKNHLSLKKQYQIISAVSEVYMANLLVVLNDKKAEWIKIPEKCRHLGLTNSAERILDEWNKTYIAEKYKAQFREFTDISTIGERLKENRQQSFIYENIFENCMEMDIVPQSISADGEIEAVMLMVRDVTESMKKEKEYQEQLRRASDAKMSFLRRMSHDIRTPINGISGMAEVAECYRDNPEKQAECMKKIKEAANLLNELLGEILDMGKLESGEIILEERPFNLKNVSGEVFNVIESPAADKGISINFGETQITHFNLIGSPVHLKRVFMNIMSNAIKYNKEHGTITISCKELKSDIPDTAVFEFKCADTGIGMSPEFQKKIFEPFAQENTENQSKYFGTGLGMPIAKSIIEKMGGTLTFESKRGIGTTFIALIPFKIDTEAEKAKEIEDNAYSIKGKRILLVEDNELNMEIAEFILENEGAIVTKAYNGQEAAEIFEKSEEGEFEVILMDLMMPVMDGYKATKKIRSMDRSDSKNIIIIAMTANAFTDDRIKTKKAGMNEHIAKPLNMKLLIETIAKLTDKDKAI